MVSFVSAWSPESGALKFIHAYRLQWPTKGYDEPSDSNCCIEVFEEYQVVLSMAMRASWIPLRELNGQHNREM
jgi:hypothetical protein